MGVVDATPGTSQFLGIPYAAPPVGNLRWRPPQAPPEHTSTLDATSFGDECPQGGSNDSEDCLFLNVYTPTKSLASHAPKTPVMVWIHGGSLTSGEGAIYDPTGLSTIGDVVVVTINYRLGALGFLAHTALSAETSYNGSGNYGIMDQQLAMEWVQQNIAAFGGNPNNVTVFGESAGGESVFSNLVSPFSAGLFKRAIIESGSYGLQLPTLAQAESMGDTFASDVGCTDTDPVAEAACLRAVPADTLVAAQGALQVQTQLPNIDGIVLPQSIDTALAAGDFNRVPVIDGTNHDEYRLFIAEAFDLSSVGPLTDSFYPIVLGLFLASNQVPLVLAEYPLANYPSADLTLATLVTDDVFSCQALDADNSFAKFVPTYVYEFADENAPGLGLPPVSFPYGAAHGFELPYLFVLEDFPAPFTPDQAQLSEDMMTYWTNFAKNGKPSSKHIPKWNMFSGKKGNQFISFVPAMTASKPISDFSNDHMCSFWQSLPAPMD